MHRMQSAPSGRQATPNLGEPHRDAPHRRAGNSERPLSSAELRRVQIAYLTLVEHEHILRLAQVRAERKALERRAAGCR